MRYRRNAEVRATDVEGEYFLVEPKSGQIYYLDQVSSGLWRLLAEPLSREELIETYAEAFPDQPAERVADEVAAALEEMLAGGLVAPVEN
jgi:hypothetical protein